ncbi:hypothetical protein diail_7 [Diaporthe ilicicola]|nr:hypothetical protein diail_7 [Diaporthe ilicicola]
MKFSVAVPIVALVPALILALLALLAGVKHDFMPDVYIVRISTKPELWGSTSKAARFRVRSAGPTQMTSAPTLPTHLSAVRDSPAKKKGHKAPSATGQPVINNGHNNITDKNESSDNENNVTPEKPQDSAPTNATGYFYSFHFLTSCQWEVKDKAKNCSKPWDLGDHLKNDFGIEALHHMLEARNHTRHEADEPKASDPVKKYSEARKVLAKRRSSFAKVHVVGCVFVGLSLLCAAISFYILPAMGRWITIGNLALTMLATIFLVTSSTFAAVLAKKTNRFVEGEKQLKYMLNVEAGAKFQGLT